MKRVHAGVGASLLVVVLWGSFMFTQPRWPTTIISVVCRNKPLPIEQDPPPQLMDPGRHYPWKVRKCPSAPSYKQIKWKSQGHEDLAIFKHYYNGSACRGTFVEIGALDGKGLSNTWAYEYFFRWRGILIEANPRSAKMLKRNRPQVTTIWSAICNESISKLEFAGGGAVGGIIETMSEHLKKNRALNLKHSVSVPCRPLAKLLNVDPSASQAVDVFFLDVEGGEYEVLKTMDWSIPVGLFVVELNGYDKEKDNNVRNVLQKHGYIKSIWNIKSFCTGDCPANEVFEHPDYVKFCEEVFEK